jgi:hypothetical protein
VFRGQKTVIHRPAFVSRRQRLRVIWDQLGPPEFRYVVDPDTLGDEGQLGSVIHNGPIGHPPGSGPYVLGLDTAGSLL